MKKSWVCGALVLALGPVLASPARADRFLVQIGDLKPVYCGDARTTILQFEPNTGMVPATVTTLATVPPVTVQPAPGVAVTPEAVAAANSAANEPTARLQGMHCNMVDVTQPQSGPPDATFLAALNAVYSITAPAEIQQVYEWYLKEPAALALGSRVGNGVVRFIMAVDRAPTGDAASRPDLLKPQATTGRVRSANGVSARGTPWQAGNGGSFANGANLTIVPPADGPWYQVQGGGWVCGLWLDLN